MSLSNDSTMVMPVAPAYQGGYGNGCGSICGAAIGRPGSSFS